MGKAKRNVQEKGACFSAPAPAAKPEWLKVKLPSNGNFFRVAELMKKRGLHTICQSARCPNMTECWTAKTATFLILGDTCTRRCGFCAVNKGTPALPESDEPGQVAEAAFSLGLEYVVITSVTRDDLEDGGASVFARTVEAVKKKIPGVKVEVLIPDFGGRTADLEVVLGAGPEVLNHNLETTESLYPRINRPAANYERSLDVLRHAKKKGARTKSGLMVGLGERKEEIIRTLSDLRRAGCDLLTIGQYLQPTPAQAPVQKYYTPLEFEQLRNVALDFGFANAVAGPLVRSSFRAGILSRSIDARREA